eukprot:CAMPEP_0185731044 /NCGR_PEP_ID=MMETSP1171-20130828/11707_1 /TAXON_ID=374046 /ORGANISM="Helicotheca tamensis, Strain CCMP826" /LENGTH=237 /DNA_ID=CAMNT_0028400213 /DNA_START=94 /DNA_END=807 /DNA_ORIENTATION=+
MNPTRALNAYNFFFRYQRTKILFLDGTNNEYTVYGAGDSLEDKEKKIRSIVEKGSTSQQMKQMEGKRPHRRTHGKISFTDLTRQVSKLWKDADDEIKAIFKKLADEDRERYEREMREMNSFDAENAQTYSTHPAKFRDNNKDVKKSSIQKVRKRKECALYEIPLPNKAPKFTLQSNYEDDFPISTPSCSNIEMTSNINDHMIQGFHGWGATDEENNHQQDENLELVTFLSQLDWKLL